MTHSQPTPKVAVPRSHRALAVLLSSAILAIGDAQALPAESPDPLSSERTLSAPAADEHTMGRCQMLYGLYSRHHSDGYARPLIVRLAMEDCNKGKIALGIEILKQALGRGLISVPPMQSATAAGSVHAPPHPQVYCDHLTSYYDRYGVGRDEDSDGARNHTRIGAGIDCQQVLYQKGIGGMKALMTSRKFDVPSANAAVAQAAP